MSAAFLEDEIAKNIFGPGDSVLAWGAGQAGKAVFACDGGYKVSYMAFCGGAGHATWLVVTAWSSSRTVVLELIKKVSMLIVQLYL